MERNTMTKPTKKSVMYLTHADYEWRGMEEGWRTDVIYQDEMGKTTDYFYSPDGVGCVWVDTLEELLANSYDYDENTPIVILRPEED
jgi:hypothetical protein